MNKRDEIREGLGMIHLGHCPYPDDAQPCGDKAVNNEMCLGCIMKWLNERVVIKVDKELPFPSERVMSRLVHPIDVMSPAHGSVIEAYRLAQQDMGEAGFEATEPLIRESE